VTEITEHLANIVERVARAARRNSRDDSNVLIVAVSKQQHATAIAEAYRAGQRDFGESYAQEAAAKMDELAGLEIVWHFIGKLQANKTRLIAERFAWVHTLDRIKIAERLNEQRSPHAPPLNVLIQVNQGAESQKGGVPVAETESFARAIGSLPRLALRGLMSIPPQVSSTTHWFNELAALRARLVAAGLPLDTLSMGMSADFEAAIAAGSTCVRVGTAIFGERPRSD
jgi:pyridoxal phosphate enzyme (YggS family)